MESEAPRKVPDNLDKPLPVWFMLLMPFYTGFVMAIFLFPFAGDWSWFEGWAYLLTFALNITISYSIINQRNPRVLRNRMKIKKEGVTAATKASAGSDRFVMPLMSIGFFGALIVPALAHRFGWPSIPVALELIGLVMTNAGLILMNMAILQNSFASKLLDINQGQKLIDTGLYAHVRHPLYAGTLVMIVTVPIALGSWWGLIPAFIAVLMLVVRIEYEEEMLVKGMDGYTDYQSRVKYKLIPRIY
ncbi:MAG: isoprenylcysteine carboxylmethyltransferase family protein [Anaerolineae bacterium]|nr:isoprenylcysteine carboxylmethyltransferase family protein [Anaerolineae bacterium]